MELTSDFDKFLNEIRLTPAQRQDAQRGHTTLRSRLEADPGLKPYIVTSFLQGSYRRGTSIRPVGDSKSDVDVVVVTNLDKNAVTPDDALRMFQPFLERHYKGKYRLQGRSWGISLSYVDLDLVVTSAPSEVESPLWKSESLGSFLGLDEIGGWILNSNWTAELGLADNLESDWNDILKENPEWNSEPLYIPDRNTKTWESTNPLGQMKWTRDKNRTTHGKFVDVVKIVKWLQRSDASMPDHPKGYLIEHMVGETCPDGAQPMAQLVTSVLEGIAMKYQAYADGGFVPESFDHAMPGHNVLAGLSPDDFRNFHSRITEMSTTARDALDSSDPADSANKWRSLLGGKFPKPPSGSGGSKPGGFKAPAVVTTAGAARFA